MTAVAKKLLDEALLLPKDERRTLALQLLESVEEKDNDRARRRKARWDALRALSGVVKLGGNAVEDCERLYDG